MLILFVFRVSRSALLAPGGVCSGSILAARELADSRVSVDSFCGCCCSPALPSVCVMVVRLRSCASHKQVCRSFLDVVDAGAGGLGLIRRVRNTPDMIAEWERNVSARWNRTVTSAPSQNLANVWFAEDFAPLSPIVYPFLGIDLGSSAGFAASMQELAATASAANAVQRASEQFLAMTGLYSFSADGNGSPNLGFNMYSTVYDDDPTRTVIVAGVMLNDFFLLACGQSRRTWSSPSRTI